jgi:hypothetical protein
MQKPAFVKQLQDAANRGQVVIIPAAAMPSHQPVEPAPPLRDRDKTSLAAALSMAFELSRTEGQVLTKLMTCDYSDFDGLLAAANHENQGVSARTLPTLLSKLRKKLAAYDIEITSLRKLGFGLRMETREKICRQLAEYDQLIAPPGEKPPSRAAPAKRRARTDQELPAE